MNKNLFREFFETNELKFIVHNVFATLLYVDSRELFKGKNNKNLIKSIENRAKLLKIDNPHFKKLLIKAIETRKVKDLDDYLSLHKETINKKLSKIPQGLDKAYCALEGLIGRDNIMENIDMYPDQIYDAMILLSEKLPNTLVDRIVERWKEEAKQHKQGGHSQFTEIFWVSRDFMDTIDDISRYRFREYFNIGEFVSAFKEVESSFTFSLLDGLDKPSSPPIAFQGNDNIIRIAFDLWLASRSHNLINRNIALVNIALSGIASWQTQEGWWANTQMIEKMGRDPKTQMEQFKYLQDAYATSLCSLNLLKLSNSDSLWKKGKLGAEWLLENQNPEGSWSNGEIIGDKLKIVPDLETTLLALETISRSGIQNVNRTIENGCSWIIQQQNSFGFWDSDSLPFPLITILVLEFFKSKDFYSCKLNPYLSMAKNFINRSFQLLLEDNINSHRLAIITAHQGMEAFLYSILILPNVNIPIFERYNRTIGMKESLKKLQEFMQNQGKLKQNELLCYQNSLDRLAYFRDEITHKGIDIAYSTCQPLIDDAFGFMKKYSLEFFGFDIFAQNAVF